jgi:thiol-disulfide isomerase/thioredoxin
MDASRPGSGRMWLVIGVAFVAFWAVYLAILGPHPRRSPTLAHSGMSERASYDWTLLDLKDQPISFERFKGKPVFLNIWATWCGPCVEEMPSIARLAADPRLRDKGIEFVCVSIDESTEVVRRFLEGRAWKMSVFRAEKTPPVFATDGIPATFIIAPDGRIVATEVGSAQWDRPEVIALLEKLASSESPKP